MRRSFFGLSILFSWSFLVGQDDAAMPPTELVSAIAPRAIGPTAFGGRIADVEAVPADPDTIYVAAASGGVFRTRNRGVTWDAVFDSVRGMISVGDLALAPSDPAIVWAGTGEPNNRQSSSWGGGVYRSLDGGDSWEHRGLAETHHIGRVVVHPTDPNTVFVAALGHLWGPNPERGLYRTRDGGAGWEKVLEISPDTGVVDVAMEANGRVLYAAAYQRRRRAWGFVGGGPEGGIYRSLDGGDHWEQLAGGLPGGVVGRIGLAIAPSRPHRVYAIVEHKEGGVFRSEDRGASWERVNPLNPRPMYYSQIRVDPANPDKVWVLGSPLYVSIDGGKSFTSEKTAEKIHVDHHALWIDPDDPDHLILGNDGGLYLSYDGSSSWHFVDNLPLAQFYAIGVDDRDPYRIYGGTQDNGSWALPSRTRSQLGITNADVENLAYGDGFYTEVHPEDHTLIFTESQNGRLYFVDADTGEERGIRPVPAEPGQEEYRFNWSSPLLVSPHDPEVLYYGGNKLFRSRDRGAGWSEISPDLTGGPDWKAMTVMGVERDDDTLSKDDGIAHYGTLTTLDESPLEAGLIVAGSDSGRVHLTRDGGESWSDLTGSFGLPGPRWVSRVVASAHDAGRLYVSFDGHQDDDFTPYVFRSDDGGSSWTNLGSALPPGTVVNCLAEHPRSPDLLAAGTEWGLFLSLDGGTSWFRVEGQLPTMPVDDLRFQARENDLVVGTHGRGIFVLDDLAFLEGLDPAAQQPRLFPVRPAVQFYERRALPPPGASEFAGPNPPYGALLTYFLPSGVAEPEGEEASTPPEIAVEILDAEGSLVRTLTGPGGPGLHRIAWDLRYPLEFEAGEDDDGWFGPPRGPFVLPGRYQAALKVGGEAAGRREFEVRSDPASAASRDELEQRLEASRRANRLLGFFVRSAQRVQGASEEVDRSIERLLAEPGQDELVKSLREAADELEELKEAFKGGWRSKKYELLDLLGQLQAYSAAPTEAHRRTLEHLEATVRENIGRFNALLSERLVDLESRLREAGVSELAGEPLPVPEG